MFLGHLPLAPSSLNELLGRVCSDRHWLWSNWNLYRRRSVYDSACWWKNSQLLIPFWLQRLFHWNKGFQNPVQQNKTDWDTNWTAHAYGGRHVFYSWHIAMSQWTFWTDYNLGFSRPLCRRKWFLARKCLGFLLIHIHCFNLILSFQYNFV